MTLYPCTLISLYPHTLILTFSHIFSELTTQVMRHATQRPGRENEHVNYHLYANRFGPKSLSLNPFDWSHEPVGRGVLATAHTVELASGLRERPRALGGEELCRYRLPCARKPRGVSTALVAKSEVSSSPKVVGPMDTDSSFAMASCSARLR